MFLLVTLQPEQLGSNTLLVSVLLVFVIVTILSWAPYGVMRQQISFLMNAQSDRTFDEVSLIHVPVRIMILIQMVVCIGLHFFLLANDGAIDAINHPTETDWLGILFCMGIVLFWYLGHWCMISWWGYLFNEPSRIFLLKRQFRAVYMLFSPFSVLVFMLEVSGHIDVLSTTFLLGLFFIISQIVLIYNANKIFWGSVEALYFIFLYLCTLEIAPLVMISRYLTM